MDFVNVVGIEFGCIIIVIIWIIIIIIIVFWYLVGVEEVELYGIELVWVEVFGSIVVGFKFGRRWIEYVSC